MDICALLVQQCSPFLSIAISMLMLICCSELRTVWDSRWGFFSDGNATIRHDRFQ